MSAHGFKSVFMVGAIASAALGCYLVSLRVASERAALESVENKIVLAQRDIRLLNTEIGTRGRLAQLERWNVKVIRLSAPSADQFVESSFQLATLGKPETRPAIEAPVIYAAAPAPARREPVVTNDDGSGPALTRATRPLGEMMHVAGYSKPDPKPVRAATKPVAPLKPVKTATADPLGPLPGARTSAKSDSGAGEPRITKTTKDPGSRQ